MDYSSHPQRFDIEAAGASAVPDDTLSYALTAAVDICVWQYDASGSLCARPAPTYSGTLCSST